MITLNLIPQKEKHELKLLGLYLATKNIIFLTLFGIIIIAIVLLGAKFVLQDYFNKVVDENYLSAGIGKFTISEIKIFKQDLKEIIKIQKDYQSWFNFFTAFNKLVSQGIAIDTLDISKNQIKISGISKNRDSLLEFKNNLDNSDLFGEFEIPLDTLFKKEDISFNLDLKFDINKLDKQFED